MLNGRVLANDREIALYQIPRCRSEGQSTSTQKDRAPTLRKSGSCPNAVQIFVLSYNWHLVLPVIRFRWYGDSERNDLLRPVRIQDSIQMVCLVLEDHSSETGDSIPHCLHCPDIGI